MNHRLLFSTASSVLGVRSHWERRGGGKAIRDGAKTAIWRSYWTCVGARTHVGAARPARIAVQPPGTSGTTPPPQVAPRSGAAALGVEAEGIDNVARWSSILTPAAGAQGGQQNVEGVLSRDVVGGGTRRGRL